VTIRQVLDWLIVFSDILYIQLVTTINYSAIALSTLYSSPLHTHTRVLSLHYWYPGNRFQHSIYTNLMLEVFFAQPNSFLAISSQSPSTVDFLS
jgi:hypothetical protein